MSLDYPDYLRIRQRSRVLGWVWLVGDRGYYLGLVGAVIAFSGGVAIALVYGAACPLGHGEALADFWRALPLCLLALPVFVLIFLLSACLKEVAHRRSGIHDEDVPGGNDTASGSGK